MFRQPQDTAGRTVWWVGHELPSFCQRAGGMLLAARDRGHGMSRSRTGSAKLPQNHEPVRPGVPAVQGSTQTHERQPRSGSLPPAGGQLASLQGAHGIWMPSAGPSLARTSSCRESPLGRTKPTMDASACGGGGAGCWPRALTRCSGGNVCPPPHIYRLNPSPQGDGARR